MTAEKHLLILNFLQVCCPLKNVHANPSLQWATYGNQFPRGLDWYMRCLEPPKSRAQLCSWRCNKGSNRQRWHPTYLQNLHVLWANHSQAAATKTHISPDPHPTGMTGRTLWFGGLSCHQDVQGRSLSIHLKHFISQSKRKVQEQQLLTSADELQQWRLLQGLVCPKWPCPRWPCCHQPAITLEGESIWGERRAKKQYWFCRGNLQLACLFYLRFIPAP